MKSFSPSEAALRFATALVEKRVSRAVVSAALPIFAAVALNAMMIAVSQTAHAFEQEYAPPVIGLSVAMSSISLQKNAGVTCAQSPVSALRIDLGQLKLVWKSLAPLQSASIVVAFENANLKGAQYVCEIDGREFDAVFGTQGASVDSSVTSLSNCNIQCGGVEMNAGAPAFSSVGTVSLFGTTQIGSASRVQQHATIPISINYVP